MRVVLGRLLDLVGVGRFVKHGAVHVANLATNLSDDRSVEKIVHYDVRKGFSLLVAGSLSLGDLREVSVGQNRALVEFQRLFQFLRGLLFFRCSGLASARV